MVLNFFLNLMIFILTLGMLILIHEYGHFLAARLLKIKVEQFSIGFGPVLWRWIGKEGTIYVISAILIGGYVKLYDKNDIEETHSKKEFVKKNFENNEYIWKRSIIIISGPVFNFMFSIFLYIIVFVIGIPVYKPIINYILPNSIIDKSTISTKSEIRLIDNNQVFDWESVRTKILDNIYNEYITITTIENIENTNLLAHTYKKHTVVQLPKNWLNHSVIDTTDPIIALGIFPNFICVKSVVQEKKDFLFNEQDKFRIGDKILSINFELIYNWNSFVQVIKNNLESKFNIVIERNKDLVYLNCSLYKSNFKNSQEMQRCMECFLNSVVIEKEQNPEICKFKLFSAIKKSLDKTNSVIHFVVNTIIHLILGDIKITTLHGPISIAKGSIQSIQSGLVYYFMFLAAISINLGIMNLLPLPILDGGQLFFLFFEGLTRRPVSKKIQSFIYYISVMTLVLITFVALYNDINI